MLELINQCTRFEVIIVVVHVGAVKIYVAAAVEALRKKEREDETQFTTKIDGFLSFIPPLNASVLFCRFFLKSHPVLDQTQGSGAVFS
jgi:NADH:ubiquinone oxidoreductase subunit 6 (subunit J)